MLPSIALAAAAATSVPPRPLVPEDTYLFETISGLEVSPDGRSILYAIERADEEQDAFVREYFVADEKAQHPRRLCLDDRDCSHPRFSPDGTRLAWIETDGGTAQLVVARSGARKGRPLTFGTEDVQEFDWSPDGTRLVFTRVDPYQPRRAPGAPQPASGAARSTERAERERTQAPHVITRTQIQRDGEGFLDDRHTHLYVVPASGGTARKITDGPYDDDSPRWSPRGDVIAFVSNRNADPDATDDTDIYVVGPAGGAARKLASNPGPDDSPSWSRTGDRLAFVGRLRPNDVYETLHAMVVPAAGGPILDLTKDLDTSVATDDVVTGSAATARLLWSRDDATLYALLERRGATWLAAIPSRGGAPKEVLGGAMQHGLVRLVPSTDRLYYTRSTPTVVSELWTAQADGSGAAKLLGPNDGAMKALRLSAPEKLAARNSDGDTVEAWLYPPLDLDPAKKYPLILYVHGGPQEYDGEFFDTGLENQLFPGKGWAVLRVNYRGSTSYGEKFCRALWKNWHTREFEDLMAAVDRALAAHAWLDKGRLGIGGWSYGGIMTVWTVGHTDRFKVAVPERFEIDYLSCFGTDQWHTQYLAELGDPFANADTYREMSPGSYVPKIATPTYLIADEDDGNCPPTQAMQLYQRLKLRGVPTELVIYPDEPHSMTTPSHYVDRLYRLVDWFGRHLK